MRIVLGGGGTGGHVYPALAVLEALRQPPFHVADGDVLYVGDGRRAEAALAARAGVPFQAIATGAVAERGPLARALSLARNAIGLAQSLAALHRFRPDAVFATGGYVSVPLIVAAWLLRVPSVVCLPDAAPGLAVRFLARFATAITVSDPASARALPGRKVHVTGYPVRPEFADVDRQASRRRLGIAPEAKVLLVMGGSLGARPINRAVARSLPDLLAACCIIHVSGPSDAAWLKDLRSGLPPDLQARYHLHPYLHAGVAEAMAAADLAVCRAGASVLGELPASGLPAVLVPYPLAGAHQRANARLLAERGAAVVLDEVAVARLPSLVLSLLKDEPQLAAMSERLRTLARPHAAKEIAGLLGELAARRSHPREARAL